VFLASLRGTRRGLKHSRKRKPYFTIELQKLAFLRAGKGLEVLEIRTATMFRTRGDFYQWAGAMSGSTAFEIF
jgi:hypothetical protein